MTCLRFPVSLADATAIVTACAGPNWRGNFVLGLGVFVAVAVLVACAVLVARR